MSRSRRVAAILIACWSQSARAEEEPCEGDAAPASELLESEPNLLVARPQQVLGVPPALTPTAAQLAEGWVNVAGGGEREAAYTGLLELGMRLDLERAGWLQGASLGLLALGAAM